MYRDLMRSYRTLQHHSMQRKIYCDGFIYRYDVYMHG